jgi:hypothetical protein
VKEGMKAADGVWTNEAENWGETLPLHCPCYRIIRIQTHQSQAKEVKKEANSLVSF